MSTPHLGWHILETLEAASLDREYLFRSGGSETRIPAGEMRGRILEFAAGLAGSGLPPRTRLPLVASTSADLWSVFTAAMVVGHIPFVLAPPTFKTHLPTYLRNLGEILRRYRSRHLVVAREYADAFAGLASQAGIEPTLLPLEALRVGAGKQPDRVSPPSGPDSDLAFLQHSSGSTGVPKGVALTHRAVLDHLKKYSQAIGLDPRRDRIVSWLPLYHDMGLITSFLLPLASATSCASIPAPEWILDPLEILRLATRERSTLGWWPNFTFSLLATRAGDADLDGLDLGSLRALVNCSEPVLPGSLEAFLARFEAAGLRPTAVSASYAMAENVFAVTQTQGPPRILSVEASSLELGSVVQERRTGRVERVASSGPPIDGVSVRIVDAARRPVGDGVVGEIALSGDFVFDRYLDLPEATAAVRTCETYFTSDLGFLDQGELFVLGRITDLVIVAGRKYYPAAIEDSLQGIPGLRPGRAVAFGVRSPGKGTEDLVVLAESDLFEDAGAVRSMAREIRMRIAQRVDCPVEDVVIVGPRTLAKTSSGKLARRDNRAWYLNLRGGQAEDPGTSPATGVRDRP